MHDDDKAERLPLEPNELTADEKNRENQILSEIDRWEIEETIIWLKRMKDLPLKNFTAYMSGPGPRIWPEHPEIASSLNKSIIWAKSNLEHERLEYEKGDSVALFRALSYCYSSRVPVPEWAGRAVDAGLLKVQSFQTGSWDEAFGRPHPKQAKLTAKSKRALSERTIAIEILRACFDGHPIDAAIYELVADRLNDVGSLKTVLGKVSPTYIRNTWFANGREVKKAKELLAVFVEKS